MPAVLALVNSCSVLQDAKRVPEPRLSEYVILAAGASVTQVISLGNKYRYLTALSLRLNWYSPFSAPHRNGIAQCQNLC